MKNSYLPVVALFLLILGCNKKEPIPAYLSIQSIEVQGYMDQKITDAWVYADGQFLGAFPLPAEIPILAEGNVTISVFPGVKEDGDYQTPAIYPLLTKYELEVPLQASKTTAIQPVVKYETDVTTVFVDDFETNSSRWFIEPKDGDSTTNLVVQASDVYKGLSSGKLTLDTAHQNFEVYSIQTNKDQLPTSGGRPCWLEISYKTDFPFYIGLAGADPGQADQVSYFQTISPKPVWSKMYINLTQALAVSDFPLYKVAIAARLPLDGNGNPTMISGSMYLDNVRLVFLK